jgi:hypothetical protein
VTSLSWQQGKAYPKFTSPYIRNGFKPAANRRITSDGAGGATIRSHLQPHLIARLWLPLALQVCAAIFTGMLISPAVVRPGEGPATIIHAALAAACIPLTLLCAVYLFSAWLARDDRQYLTATLARLLEASVIARCGAGTGGRST